MNEIVWYSRVAVLVGALVLLIQAFTGRALGVMTLLAVVLLGGGFIVFLAALALTETGLPSFMTQRPVPQIEPESDGSAPCASAEAAVIPTEKAQAVETAAERVDKPGEE